MSKVRRATLGAAWVLVPPIAVAFILDALYFLVLEPRGFSLAGQASTAVYVVSSVLLWSATGALAFFAYRGRLPGTGIPQPAAPAGE